VGLLKKKTKNLAYGKEHSKSYLYSEFPITFLEAHFLMSEWPKINKHSRSQSEAKSKKHTMQENKT